MVEFLLEDQDVRCLAADPLNPAVIYAETQGDGVLRSDDRGKSWQLAGMQGQIVKSLAVSPHESGTVYAGTKPPHERELDLRSRRHGRRGVPQPGWGPDLA